MKAISNIFKGINSYFIVSLLAIIIGILILSFGEKIAIHLYINNLHTPFFDTLFTYVTYFGDGLFVAITVLVITILSKKGNRLYVFLLGAITLLLSGLFSQFLKQVIFPGAYRPRKFIGDDLLYLIPDLDVHSMNSFPSGHTTTAFALFAFLSFVLFRKSIIMQVIMAIMAIIIGYSRMYLSQHFLEDIVAGAVIGLLAYIIAAAITNKIVKRNSLS